MNIRLLQHQDISDRSLFFRYFPFLVLALIWVIIQSLLFYRFGLVTGFEAEKYIYEANYFLANGTVSTPNYWLYSVQIFLIAEIVEITSNNSQ